MVSKLVIVARNWLMNWAAYLLRKSDYLTLLPPFFSSALVFSRKSRSIRRFALRSGSSDIFSFIEIFQKESYRVADFRQFEKILETYRSIVDAGKCPLIIDCGTNNGLSARYFSDIWPESKIVAIEPDLDNIEMIRCNTSNLDIDILQAGISSEKKCLAIANPNSDSNAFQTIPDNKGTIKGTTIAEIVGRFDPALFELFVVKVDIEGFESDLFACNTEWIDDSALVAIELHDWMLPGKAISGNFLRAVAARNRDFVCSGDVIFSIRNGDADLLTLHSFHEVGALAF